MEKTYMDVEDMEVYQKLCKLHIIGMDIGHWRSICLRATDVGLRHPEPRTLNTFSDAG